MNNSYSKRINITKYTQQGKDYLGAITTALLLKEALDTLSIDLKDQFCFINELYNLKGNHTIVITGSDKSLVEEVEYQFEKNINSYNLTLVAKHFDIDLYSLSA